MNLKLPPVSPTGPQEALARQSREDGSGSGGGIGQNFEKLLQQVNQQQLTACLLYTSPSPRDED